MAYPGDPSKAVLLRRVEAAGVPARVRVLLDVPARVRVLLDVRAGSDHYQMSHLKSGDGI
ncbi:MAG: hypothetical protein ACR2FU_11030 [Streptosporangiaceae bacterium]